MKKKIKITMSELGVFYKFAENHNLEFIKEDVAVYHSSIYSKGFEQDIISGTSLDWNWIGGAQNKNRKSFKLKESDIEFLFAMINAVLKNATLELCEKDMEKIRGGEYEKAI